MCTVTGGNSGSRDFHTCPHRICLSIPLFKFFLFRCYTFACSLALFLVLLRALTMIFSFCSLVYNCHYDVVHANSIVPRSRFHMHIYRLYLLFHQSSIILTKKRHAHASSSSTHTRARRFVLYKKKYHVGYVRLCVSELLTLTGPRAQWAGG